MFTSFLGRKILEIFAPVKKLVDTVLKREFDGIWNVSML